MCIRRLWSVVLISPKSHPAAVFTICNPWEGVGFLSGLFHLMYSALLEIRFSAWFYFPDKIPWDQWEKCLSACLDVYFRLPWACSLNSFYLCAGECRSLTYECWKLLMSSGWLLGCVLLRRQLFARGLTRVFWQWVNPGSATLEGRSPLNS